MTRRMGRPQGRKKALEAGVAIVTCCYSLPQSIAAAVSSAAKGRDDQNKSAVVREVLAGHFGIALNDGDSEAESESEGGEVAEK